MSVHDERRSFRTVDAWPGIGFALLYLLTLSHTLSVTHDSALFLRPIETLRPALVPNHLWFEPIMTSAYRLFMLVWPDIGAQRAAEAVNALAGAMALQAAYAIGVWRIGLTRRQAALAVTCAGLTYGVWYYSIAIETYALPLALTAWTFYGITSRCARWPVVLACAVGHSVAILCHQSAVLFGAVAIGALLSDGRFWRSRLIQASAYVVVCSLLVGGAYATAVISMGYGQSVGRAARWSVGHLPRRNFWSRPPRAFVLAAAGATRAMVGGQFVFAVPSLATRIDQWFPRNDPVDERFFVRTVTPSMAWLLAGLAVVALASMGALMILAAWTIWMDGFHVVGRVTALLAGWLTMYCGFFAFWDPANPDFWVVQVYLAPLLAMAILSRVRPAGIQTVLFLSLASSLLVVNGLGTVRLAGDPANDYYAVYLRSVARELEAGDVLILGDHWPIRTHLERLPVDAVFLSVEIAGVSPADLAEKVRRFVDAGRRVFVAPDVVEVTSVARTSYGLRYVTYVQRLRGLICGLGPPRGERDEMVLREVTCFR